MTTPKESASGSKSALENLKNLSKKKPVGPGAAALSVQMNDPALAGAVRKGKSSVVTLGFDMEISESTLLCAELQAALEDAKTRFAVEQATIRDYGKKKRDLYNDTFKADVTTVCVPYRVEVPIDENSSTPGYETHVVQVICSARYSVAQETVLANRETIGEDLFPKLFDVDRKKILKPNAEELVRGVLSESGLTGEELENAMDALFEESVSVKTTESYEMVEKTAPEGVRKILAQAVTRAQPGLKFP